MTGLPCVPADEFVPVRMQRVAEMQIKLAWVARRNSLQRGPATLVALHRYNPLGAFQQERSRQPAWSGTDLDHRLARERSCSPRDATRQVEVQNKVLTKRLARRELQRAHDIAKRR